MSDIMIAHAEIPSTDFERSKIFYSHVFKWEFKPFGNGYLLYNNRKGTTIGLRKVDEVQSGDTTIFHILVDSIDTVMKALPSAAGKVYREKTSIPVYGAYALVQDPDGNVIGLYEKQ